MTAATELEQKLTAFADSLIRKAADKDIPVEQSIRIFKELREFYAILTKGQDKGDNPDGRRPTSMSDMRMRIALVDGGEPEDGRA